MSEGPAFAGRSLGLDWITLVGPEGRTEDVERVLSKYFGPVKETGRSGQFFCSSMWRFEGGAKVHFDHRTEPICVVDLRGSVLTSLDADTRVQLLTDLMCLLGFKCTRIDVAQDFVHCGLGLVSKVEASCDRLEVAHNPVCSVVKPQRGGELQGYSVTIGKKGSAGSGRQICVYDKGLEQQERGEGLFWKPGEWERWETRFYDGRANEVAMALVVAVCERRAWHDVAKGFMLGAVDFRCANGEKSLEDRPLASWWAEFIEFTKLASTSAKRRLQSLASRMAWLRKQVVPGLAAMASEVGQTAADLVETLFAEVRAGPRDSVVCREFRRWIEAGADAAELGGFGLVAS